MPTELRAVAYLNHGRWVAACPRPGCMNAEMRGKCDDGSEGGLEAELFRCRISSAAGPYGGCGLICPVDWPPEIAEIEALVMCRPIPTTRNWLPGEDLHDLLRENLEHGIVPTAALEGRPGRLLTIHGSDVTAGELESAERPAIEGG